MNHEPKLGLIVFVVLSITGSCLSFASIPYGVLNWSMGDMCITWFGLKQQCWSYTVDATIDDMPFCVDFRIRLKVGMALIIVGSIATVVSAFLGICALANGRTAYWRKVAWIGGTVVSVIFGVILALGITLMLQVVCGYSALKDQAYMYGVGFGFQATVFSLFSFITVLMVVEWFGILEFVYEFVAFVVKLIREVPHPKRVRFVSFFAANGISIVLCALSMGVPIWYQTWTTNCANLWGLKPNCFLGVTDNGYVMPNQCTTFNDIYTTGRVFACLTLGFILVSGVVVFVQYKTKSVRLRHATVFFGFFVSALSLVTWSCFAAINHRVLCPGQIQTFKDQGWSWGPAFVFWVTTFIFMFIASVLHALIPPAF